MQVKKILYLYFILLPLFSYTQNISGSWQGIVLQNNSQDTFTYTLDIEQNGSAVIGKASSLNKGKALSADFQVSGQYNNGQLNLQEIKQISPDAPQWCLKYMKVSLKNATLLEGEWTAPQCAGGSISMKRIGARGLAPTYEGRWVGHLSQTDRPYGFYYELNLQADGTGQSHIVSEGAGGEAHHQLEWQITDAGITFTELAVSKRTQADWKWCLKSADLQGNTDQLTGLWEGYIEGKTKANGACAPGSLELNPVRQTLEQQETVAPIAAQYQAEQKRNVRVDRVIKVKSDRVRIRVWDNGIVDGDILSLFLNGRRIVKEYRVNKRKWSIPVEIIQGENLLILHAEDLGDISPNTVAVSIDDGVDEHIIVLSSNLDESGAILIQPFEY